MRVVAAPIPPPPDAWWRSASAGLSMGGGGAAGFSIGEGAGAAPANHTAGTPPIAGGSQMVRGTAAADGRVPRGGGTGAAAPHFATDRARRRAAVAPRPAPVEPATLRVGTRGLSTPFTRRHLPACPSPPLSAGACHPAAAAAAASRLVEDGLRWIFDGWRRRGRLQHRRGSAPANHSAGTPPIACGSPMVRGVAEDPATGPAKDPAAGPLFAAAGAQAASDGLRWRRGRSRSRRWNQPGLDGGSALGWRPWSFPCLRYRGRPRRHPGIGAAPAKYFMAWGVPPVACGFHV